jgi:hypothetical protein
MTWRDFITVSAITWRDTRAQDTHTHILSLSLSTRKKMKELVTKAIKTLSLNFHNTGHVKQLKKILSSSLFKLKCDTELNLLPVCDFSLFRLYLVLRSNLS